MTSGYESPVPTADAATTAATGAWYPDPPAKGSPEWHKRERDRIESERRKAERDARIAAFNAEIARQASARRATVWIVYSQAESDDRNYEAWHLAGNEYTGIVAVCASLADAHAARLACIEAHYDSYRYNADYHREHLAENLIVVELPVLDGWA